MNHQFVSPFEHFGECDLTAHVNFAHISQILLENKMTVFDTVSQGDFLSRLGIIHRAEALKKNASSQQGQDIDLALTRLIGKDTKNNQMGDLFKVIGFSSSPDIQLEGFR
jgi:SAM-dependent MidA family methyltransferase